MEKKCENCKWFRIKAEEFGICDNLENKTKCMSTGLIKKLTDCDDEIAFEINESIRFHKDFGCIHFNSHNSL